LGPLERALRFTWAVNEAAADEVVRIDEGAVLRTPSHPDAWSVNCLRLEPALGDLDLAGVERLGGEHLATPYLHVDIEEDATALRLFDAAKVAGWKTERELVMLLDRAAAPVERGDVREGTLDEVLGLVGPWFIEEGEPPDTVEQLVDRARREHAVYPERLVIGEHEGAPAAMATVRVSGGVAQVEDVYALPQARGAGLGRAVTQEAVRLAAESGAEVIFIVADDQDWPKQLYAKLGFRPAGHRAQLHRPPG
jgi:ribosomal protein S18 acetylase RimI-like enzyme